MFDNNPLSVTISSYLNFKLYKKSWGENIYLSFYIKNFNDFN